MSLALQSSLDALTVWRRGLDRGLAQLVEQLDAQGLMDGDAQAHCDALRQRLASDRLVVAFVAEFSRGKSELINALFFADAGRRVMPATPGRTTMCPVELAWDAERPPELMLLPIDTRITGQPVAMLRQQPTLWRRAPLPMNDARNLARVLEQVTQTRRVPVEEARSLGLWDDEHPDDNPPADERGEVEVPAWRHALINYPHPLLKRGLVVLDTPGLNAIGAEPELTLSLLPSAHATVYLLAADTGVTKSDLSIWRDHLNGPTGLKAERFVVLNKIDTLQDPLLKPAQVVAQIERQQAEVAATLGVPVSRVYPLSARQALAARVRGHAGALRASRLPELEQALQTELLPQRAAVIGRMVGDGLQWLREAMETRLEARRRQFDDQLSELRSLRGKSGSRLALMGSRLQNEAADFERCVPHLAAVRVVLNKHLQQVLDSLGTERVRAAVLHMRDTSQGSLLRLGAARAFAELGAELRQALTEADRQVAEIEMLLGGSQRKINAEFGFSLGSSERPTLEHAVHEVERIEASYSRYLGLTQLWRQAQPGFMNQFSRMLTSKLRMVFENASGEVEAWVKGATSQMDAQLRDRRRALSQRRESFERIQSAESELERSIVELELQETQVRGQRAQFDALLAQLQRLVAAPGASQAPDGSVDITLDDDSLRELVALERTAVRTPADAVPGQPAAAASAPVAGGTAGAPSVGPLAAAAEAGTAGLADAAPAGPLPTEGGGADPAAGDDGRRNRGESIIVSAMA